MNKRRKPTGITIVKRLLLATLLAQLLLSDPLLAQTTTITGVIRNPRGEVMPGVSVSLFF